MKRTPQIYEKKMESASFWGLELRIEGVKSVESGE